MSSIYLAARYSRRLELLGYKTQLEEAGHEVTSRWLLGEHAALDQDWASLPNETVAKWAEDDLEDIEEAEVFVMFTEEPGEGGRRGGRHVEFGFALALETPIVIVGPRENTFHCSSFIEVFPTFQECLGWINFEESDRES